MPTSSKTQPRYKRVLLKLSGEALMGEHDFGIDPKVRPYGYAGHGHERSGDA